MSDFTEIVQQDTPRLMVRYAKVIGGMEKFDHTVVGGIPALSMVGAVIHAQVQLLTRDPYLGRCSDSCLVIAWDKDTKEFHYFVDSTVPVEPLAGYLEVIKDFVKASLVQKAVPKSNILGPDGHPIRG